MVLLLFVLMFNLLILSPVILISLGSGEIANLVYYYFSPICHQIDSRSFHISGIKLAVCSRCSSIYFGILIAVLIFPFVRTENLVRKANLLLVIGALPSVVEFSIEKFLGFENTGFKVLTGLLLGIVAGIILTYQIVDMFSKRR